MSAALVIPISQAPEPHLAKIPKGKWARTRLGDLAAFSRMTQCEIGIHCFVHAESVGWGQAWTRATIRITTLATHCNQEPRTVNKTLSKTEQEGTIKRRKISGGFVYSRVRPIDVDSDQETWGNCATCHGHSLYVVDRDVLIPHSLFLNVQRAVDRGMFLCALFVALKTIRSKDGQIQVHPTQLTVDDFERGTGLKKSEVENDIKKCETLGIFQSAGRRGAIQTYWVTPENWTTIGVRPKRVGGNPSPVGRTKSKLTIVEPPQPKQADTKQTSPPEFLSKPCGVCVKCGTWSVIDVVPAPENLANPVRKPLARAREGPKQSKSDQFWEKVKADLRSGTS
jgi:hypothetical protein